MKVKQINNIIIYKKYDKYICVHNKIVYEEFTTQEDAETWSKKTLQFLKK